MLYAELYRRFLLAGLRAARPRDRAPPHPLLRGFPSMRFANPHAALAAAGRARRGDRLRASPSRARRRRLARLGDAALVGRMTAAVSVPRKVAARGAGGRWRWAAGRGAGAAPGGRAGAPRQAARASTWSSPSTSRGRCWPRTSTRRAWSAPSASSSSCWTTLGGDRVGVVAFAGETLTYPPTTDYAAVKLFWRDLGPWDMPVGGTAIGRAISAALTELVALARKGRRARRAARSSCCSPTARTTTASRWRRPTRRRSWA